MTTKTSMDASTADFEQTVLAASHEIPVLVDFWAPWCGPCRALGPVLEELAQEYQGRFRLVKVNSDDNPELSQRFGIRSIPNVKAFVNGQVVDEFLGARPKSAVRQFIDAILPTPADRLCARALGLQSTGMLDQALALAAQAVQLEPDNDFAHTTHAELLLALNRIDDAQRAADAISPLASQQPRVMQLMARLRFANGAQGADATALEQRIEANPSDLEARLALANAHVQAQRYEPALEQLLEIIRADRKWNQEAGRKTMLAVFDLLGSQNELVTRYRRRLAATLN